ncbi:MAG: UbiA prenyltransferase family protein [Flavobacteriales bacterium]
MESNEQTEMKIGWNLLRVKSWVKNGFLFLPAIFSLHLLQWNVMYSVFMGTFVFSLISSFVYINNDIKDAGEDALHPRKKHRPIAAGLISKTRAFFVGIILLIIAFSVFFITKLPLTFLSIVLTYLLLNLLYSFWLKTLPLLELFIVAINFVLRVLAGCSIIAVKPSHWILVVTFFLAFLMVVVKRKSEITQLQGNAVNHRTVLKAYSVGFLNTLTYIAATITITAYLLYSIDPAVVKALGTDWLMYSSLFVLMGVIRFIQISEQGLYEGEGDPTTLLFKDRFLQGTVSCWILYLIGIIYV